VRQPPAPPARLDLPLVLSALADPIRLSLIAQLRGDTEVACGEFDTTVAKSTLSHHFKKLREAGVIATERDGARAVNRLRSDELDAAFPGLLDCVLDAYLGRPIARR
jgi:DNA-binding transcriptional ArsR family regulator